jgi:uncharacterized repeat protein (TIGR03803 family)
MHSNSCASSCLASLVLTLAMALAPTAAAAQTYTDLHDFNCAAEGCTPYVPGLLAQGRDGNLYGTTQNGGTHGVGTVFKASLAGVITTLYNFDTTTGSMPFSGVSLGSDGNLYGTTFAGGTFSNGTIFKITPAGVFTVLHHFGSVSGDGRQPYGPPIQAKDGSFYGVTGSGVTGSGSAYKITSTGVFKLLNPSGFFSFAPLIQATDGNFYGTVEAPVPLVFKMTTAGKQTTLYGFDGTHGLRPFGPVVQGSDGNLYGTTYDGGASNLGVVFKLTLKGVITVLVNADATFGHLYPGLVAATDGNFYSATLSGGTASDGILFKMTPAGVPTVESNFDGTHGLNPLETAMQDTNGKIYGLTNAGGSNGVGVFYRLDAGIPPFAKLALVSGKVGATVGVFGQGFLAATGVTFGGTPAAFVKAGDGYLTATVPAGAKTGSVVVLMPSGNLTSSVVFKVTP